MQRFGLTSIRYNPEVDPNSAEFKVIAAYWEKELQAANKRLGTETTATSTGTASFAYPAGKGWTREELWAYQAKTEGDKVVSLVRQKEGKPINFGMKLWLQRWPWVAGGVGLTGLAAWGIYTLTKKR